jgi:hypothetical protein
MESGSAGNAMNLIEEIEQIVARETSSRAEHEVWRIGQAIAALPGVATRGLLERSYLEYVIQIGRGDALKNECAVLTWVRPLELAAAPEVAALLPITNGHVLVRRYWACAGERVLPVETTNAAFREPARRRFRQDMDVLAAHDKIHAYARGIRHWFVGETSGTIVLNSWFALKPCSEPERDELFEWIDDLLASRAEP